MQLESCGEKRMGRLFLHRHCCICVWLWIGLCARIDSLNVLNSLGKTSSSGLY